MRERIPANVVAMMDAFCPYLYRDKADKQFKLRADTPEEIVQIKTKYDAWCAEHPVVKEG